MLVNLDHPARDRDENKNIFETATIERIHGHLTPAQWQSKAPSPMNSRRSLGKLHVDRYGRLKSTDNPQNSWDDCIFAYIYHENKPHVGKYTLHG